MSSFPNRSAFGNNLLLVIGEVIYLTIWRRGWDLLEGLGEFPDTMTAYGHSDEYRLGQDWDEYVERLDTIFHCKLDRWCCPKASCIPDCVWFANI